MFSPPLGLSYQVGAILTIRLGLIAFARVSDYHIVICAKSPAVFTCLSVKIWNLAIRLHLPPLYGSWVFTRRTPPRRRLRERSL